MATPAGPRCRRTCSTAPGSATRRSPKENTGRAEGLAALAPWTAQIDTSALLTPGYVFRRTMTIDGRETTIRTDDGMHLTPPAGRLVAARVEAAMRADRILP